MATKIITIFILNLILSEINGYAHLDWEPANPAFNQSFYENFLDSEQCATQLAYIRNNTILNMQFIESGLRIPRGILLGNTLDFGNYMQCLGIYHNDNDMNIEGKYCSISIPFNQSIELPDWIDKIPEWIEQIPDWINFDPRKLKMEEETIERLNNYERFQSTIRAVNGDFRQSSTLPTQFTLAVCVPKTCTTEEGINGLLFNLNAFGFEYTDNYCRLNNDKPWVPADYIAVTIFSLIATLTIISTSYDIWHTHIRKSDPKSISTLSRSFSLYTNCRRLTTFTTNPGALECVDGIRALSMLWVILGHTFSTLYGFVNLLDTWDWTRGIESLWITVAPISVDTFFMLSGMLLVYTTAGKLTGEKLLKSVHLFYLNRLLRMFPLLAAGILLQVSILHRISDGPDWNEVMRRTESCRTYWWSTLLYVQNFVNTGNMCLPHSWYLAIDMQLYIISPLILFFVVGRNRKMAWSSLLISLLVVLAASTAYIFIQEFPGSIIHPARADDANFYMYYYYVNTITRASPFFVGMLFGYLLHLWRGKTLVMSKAATLVVWCCVLTIMLAVIFSSHPMKSLDWDNQIFDSFVNAFSRPLWAMAIGVIIFMCVHGYGGCINWFLSLQIWKLPSRLSYGMYIFHFPMMYVSADSKLQPIYFTVGSTLYRFLSEFSLALLVSFVMTLLIDSPLSTLIKLMMGGGVKKPVAAKPEETKNQLAIDAVVRKAEQEVREKYIIREKL